MTSHNQPVHWGIDYSGPKDSELEDFEDKDFHSETFVLDKLRHVEQGEKASWKLAMCGNSFSCKSRSKDYKCATNAKNALRIMIADSKGLHQRSTDRIIKFLISHHTLIIQTLREVAHLERDILKLRSLLHHRTAEVRSLMVGTCEIPLPITETDPAFSAICDARDNLLDCELEEHVVPLPDLIDILLAERKVDQVLLALEEGEELVHNDNAGSNQEGDLNPVTPITASFLQVALTQRRTNLVEYLAAASQYPSVQLVELRSAIATLNRLGEGTRAHTLLLLSHYGRLKHNIQGLRLSHTSYGGALTAALSQMAFSAISQAARDSLTIFGEIPIYASELVVWARSVTEFYAHLLKQHVLSSAAAAGGLCAAAVCVQIAFGYCSLLEAQGLAMCPLLSKILRPSVEQALEANLKRIDESVTAMALADDWEITLSPSTPYSRLRKIAQQCQSSVGCKITSSAHQFNIMAQDLMEGVSPILSIQFAGVALDGLYLVFNNYTDILIKALPTAIWAEREQTVHTKALQLVLLSNASMLASELLPQAAFKLLPSSKESKADVCGGVHSGIQKNKLANFPTSTSWQKKLNTVVRRLQDHICQQYVKHLLHHANNEEQLTPRMYLVLDEEGHENLWSQQDPMPSHVYQSLFTMLTFIKEAGEEAAVDKERVIVPLLTHLLEVFVCAFAEDKFWSIIEDGPHMLGPFGLQQFVLDMQFIMEMTSNGGYHSILLHHIIPQLTTRALHAFIVTGDDHERVLPTDDWFVETAQIALQKMIEGRDNSSQSDLNRLEEIVL